MSVQEASGTGEMTLAFSLAASERLADPAGAFADAREWSRYVGIIDNDTDRVREFLDRHDLQHDYELGDTDVWLAMEAIREEAGTPRHVYVGTDVEDRRVASHLEWEFVPLTEAADRADWSLTTHCSDTTLIERLRARVPFLS